MKILVFTEGTVLMHPALADIPKNKRVEKSKTIKRTTEDFKRNIPVGNAVDKLWKWKNQNAQIYYLTSRTIKEQVEAIRKILKKYNFPDCRNLLHRQKDEEYKDIAERLMPDILVEDDCESIGGELEMTYPHIRVREDLKKKIKSIVVKEFGGIDHLPDRVSRLITNGD